MGGGSWGESGERVDVVGEGRGWWSIYKGKQFEGKNVPANDNRGAKGKSIKMSLIEKKIGLLTRPRALHVFAEQNVS